MKQIRIRPLIIAILLVAIAIVHWIVPRNDIFFQGLHIGMRKFFVLPIVLAAIWFNLRGAIGTAAGATFLYLPHILFQWQGHLGQNLNQVGEVVTMWVVAVLAGTLIGREKGAWQQVTEVSEGALTALVTALDARERETERHSIRVRSYTRRIARELDLPAEDLEALSQAALLHDVGKIGIPDHILLKPGPLNDEEKLLMKQHPVIGHRILQSATFLREAAEAVLAHHENYDGSGYPAGLRAEGIPLAARIFAVADTYDALTSGRPYQKAIDSKAACRVIQAEMGKRFDPHVVRAFLRVPLVEWTKIARNVRPSPLRVAGSR